MIEEFTITPLDPNIGAPKIKYNLHDEGKKISYLEMNEIITKYAPAELQRFIKESTSTRLHLPFLLVTGRSDGTISINGTNIYPQQVEIALMKDKKLFSYLHTFRISGKVRDREQFIVKIELNLEVKRSKELESKFTRSLLRDLVLVSEEYQQASGEFPDIFTPRVELYHHGEGPFMGAHTRIKHKYIE